MDLIRHPHGLTVINSPNRSLINERALPKRESIRQNVFRSIRFVDLFLSLSSPTSLGVLLAFLAFEFFNTFSQRIIIFSQLDDHLAKVNHQRNEFLAIKFRFDSIHAEHLPKPPLPSHPPISAQWTATERLADDAWEGSIRYGRTEPPQTGDSTYSFDTGGGTQHVTQSLATTGVWAAPGVFPPNYRGGIGVTKDGVEGVDITVPVYNFSETHYIDAALVTGAYKSTLFYLTGTVNNGGFRGFAAGEVLFLGAAGSLQGQEDWEISYRFAASPNVQGLQVGDITGIAKRGWDYLWIRYADIEDSDAKMLVKRPLSVYVEQVYPYTNFAGLGIGV